MGNEIKTGFQSNSLSVKMGFVILHYRVADVTEECIENLLKQNYQNYNIVVVDNFSDNGSLEFLQQKYCENPKIYFVPLEQNFGFAKANDLGYQIAKHKFSSRIIVVINNDLMIKDPEFCNLTCKSYGSTGFDIMGPDIINKSGEHQNPFTECVTTEKVLNKLILWTRIRLVLVPVVYGLLRRKKTNSQETKNKKLETQKNIPLHGSCVVFGTKFIDRYEFPFCPDTFLYGEEELLFCMVKQKKLLTIFEPSIKVHHMDDASTDSILKSSKDKRVFELKNSLKSLLILKKHIKVTDTELQ